MNQIFQRERQINTDRTLPTEKIVIRIRDISRSIIEIEEKIKWCHPKLKHHLDIRLKNLNRRMKSAKEHYEKLTGKGFDV